MDSQRWVSFGGAAVADLEAFLARRVEERERNGEFPPGLRDGVGKLPLLVEDGRLDLPDVFLERLRRLCQLWELDLQIGTIRSHRPLIGPCIVFGKKIMFRLLRGLLGDVLEQQREFNANSIALLKEICVEVARQRPSRQ